MRLFKQLLSSNHLKIIILLLTTLLNVNLFSQQEFTVTNTNDAGLGSLRQAIIDANSNLGLDVIRFNIPGTLPFTIQPLSELPWITDQVTIDGTSQPGFVDKPIVGLNGSLAGPEVDEQGNPLGPYVNGLVINAANCIVKGLVINQFSSNGIHVLGGPSNGGNRIIGNFLGTDNTGMIDLGNGFPTNTSGSGVVLNTSGNIVGGMTSEERNLISGNTIGVVIQSPDANNNQVIGNYIGTDITGTIAIPNSNHGVYLGDGTGNVIGPNNLISGNTIFGVLLIDIANGNTVIGNKIGTDVTGTIAIPNFIGVHLLRATNNTVGGTNPQDRNIISGNTNEGILIYGTNETHADGNIIQGNYIGTDITGTLPLGNQTNGIRIDNNSRNNLIGGSNPDERNIISGNMVDGVYFHGRTTENNLIKGNYIGVDVSGKIAIANGGNGVAIRNSANNTIGGIVEGERNVISGNLNNGLIIEHSVDMLGNNIYGNFIGTDNSGMQKVSNQISGVCIINSSHNMIGDKTVGAGNLISGNKENGITIFTTGSTNFADSNKIQGNIIGLNILGSDSLSNNIGIKLEGLYTPSIPGRMYNVGYNFIGEETDSARNIISGNQAYGIFTLHTTHTFICKNYIGTDITGNIAIGNGYTTESLGLSGGIISLRSYRTCIGAIEIPGIRYVWDLPNIISGNFGPGIKFGIAPDEPEYYDLQNCVVSNKIGTNKEETTAIPNKWGIVKSSNCGVSIQNNVIGGNLNGGIKVEGTIGCGFYGNFIGLSSTTLAPLPNEGDGIKIDIGNYNNSLMGVSISQDPGYSWPNPNNNIIAFNKGNGITMINGIRIGIIHNKIYSNEKLGIDIGDDGVNYPSSAWSFIPNSPNNSICTPVITSAIKKTSQTQIVFKGYFYGLPNKTYRFRSYTNSEQDESGYGEGRAPNTDYWSPSYFFITTDGSGLGIIDKVADFSESSINFLTMTITDENYCTSEFSNAMSEIIDNDSDGIEDLIDQNVGVISNEFSYDGFNGTIADRGFQEVYIMKDYLTGGVQVSTSITGGSNPAVINYCNGDSVLVLNAGSIASVKCGSVTVKVIAGNVKSKFFALDERIAYSNIRAGNSIYFDNISFTFSAPATNRDTLIILVNGVGYKLAAGETREIFIPQQILQIVINDLTNLLNTFTFKKEVTTQLNKSIGYLRNAINYYNSSQIENAFAEIDKAIVSLEGIISSNKNDTQLISKLNSEINKLTYLVRHQTELVLNEVKALVGDSNQSLVQAVKFYNSGISNLAIGKNHQAIQDFSCAIKFAFKAQTSQSLVMLEQEKEIEVKELPAAFELYQNYPNPFNPTTTINYQLPVNGFVTIKVYDLLGKVVATLVNENEPAGYYKVDFDASSAKGGLTSGVYIYTIAVNNPLLRSGQVFIQSRKMLLVK